MRKTRQRSLLDDRFERWIHVRGRRKFASTATWVPAETANQKLFKLWIVLSTHELRRSADQRYRHELLPDALHIRVQFGTPTRSNCTANVRHWSSLAISIGIRSKPFTAAHFTSIWCAGLRRKLSNLSTVREWKWVLGNCSTALNLSRNIYHQKVSCNLRRRYWKSVRVFVSQQFVLFS